MIKKKKKKKKETIKISNYDLTIFNNIRQKIAHKINLINLTKTYSTPKNILDILKNNKNNHKKMNNKLCFIFNDCRKECRDDTIIPSIVIKKILEKVIKPFWNNKCKKLSDKLYLPTNDNLIINNEQIGNFGSTWFDNKFYKAKNTNDYKMDVKLDKINMDKYIGIRKIKIYFNTNQRPYMRQVYGFYRYFYNRTISYINNYNSDKKTTTYYTNPSAKKDKDKGLKSVLLNDIPNKFSFYTIRKIFLKDMPEWSKNLHNKVACQAINEACINYKTCMKKYKKDRKIFKLKYKRKSDKIQTIKLEDCVFSKNKNTFFPSVKINGQKIFNYVRSSEIFKDYKIRTSTLTYNKKLNEYYLNLCHDMKKTINHECKDSICSIDLGVRTFATVYSENHVDNIGNNVIDRIKILCKEIDIMKSKLSRNTYQNKNKNYRWRTNKKKNRIGDKKRKSMIKAMHRKIKKIQNTVNELHNKTINYLIKNYNKILISPFETKSMVNRLNSRISRNMMTLSFYKFREKLKNKCNVNNVTLVINGEEYTSKTCTKCGNIKYNLGCNKIYKCVKCGLKIDRDINGARNIMLKNIKNI
jgi:putative transposase